MNINYLELLQSRSRQLNASVFLLDLLERYPQFIEWSGSHAPVLHHYGKGGLLRHTSEVIELGLSTIPQLQLESKVDPTEYFLAALFHDTGKMFDYERITGEKNTLGDPVGEYWKSSEHKRLIHHISRSALIWHETSIRHPNKYQVKVLHAILAHHGRRDQGSPVAPKTRVAWLLHLCDGLSARMDDCDRLDVVHPPTL